MSGIQASVYRVGQLSGASDTGAWTVKEWIPKITKTSIALNAVPDIGGIISWIPMNKVAPIVLEITMDPLSTPPPVALSVIHPRPVTWTSVMNNMLKHLLPLQERKSSAPMKMMPFTEWMNVCEAAVATGGSDAAERYPAFALLDRMRDFASSSPPMEDNASDGRTKECGGWPWLSMDVVLGASKTMRGLLEDDEVLGERHVAAWIRYWQEQSLLPVAV
ncbi:hypothetical protein BDP27DRAFT_1434384 [Rhodocollybia butyracea]|uniref:Uncharacterized protein n=1 Tax=Rhodocollybia butyracea TaxID=206335 RepID=A0A9P5P8B7_9AGAR|nr:hypothetical protein BDP27DRAFT_1434384 [Rhodocollybia butyracea]